MVAGVKFASNSWTVGGRADLYTGAVYEAERRQPLHNPGKFISAWLLALLPLRALDQEYVEQLDSDGTPLGCTNVTAASRRVVSTCVHPRETCGEEGPPAGTGFETTRAIIIHLHVRDFPPWPQR